MIWLSRGGGEGRRKQDYCLEGESPRPPSPQHALLSYVFG